MHIYFHEQPADYCDSYPVTSYQLQVDGPTSHSSSISKPSRSFTMVDKLLENYVYMFNITVSNAVGNVSTNSIEICKSLNSIECLWYC